jgi:hypothetical protein
MTVTSENVIAIAGMYLALVGLLGAFFFVSLGQWLNGILGTESKWKMIRGRSGDQYWDKKIECYFEARQSSSPATFVAWLAVTAFQIVLFFLIYLLYANAPQPIAAFVFLYVNLPCYIFLGIYLVLSGAMLIIGYKKAKFVFGDAAGKL